MLFDRLRIAGIALIFAALSLASWKTVLRLRQQPEAAAVPPAAGLTIPVEIVEAGQPPRLREVRVGR